MSEDSGKLDRVIDEALRALTGGAPADGLRRRVLARIAAVAEPARSGGFGVFNWRAHPLRRASVVALAVLALAGALFVSTFLQRRPKGTVDTATVSIPMAPAAHAAAVAKPPVPVVEPVSMVNATTRPLPSLAPIHHDTLVPVTTAADEEANAGAVVGIAPLPDPIPIADRPIEITPLVIQPVVNREIQIPLIESDRPQKAPGQTDKR